MPYINTIDINGEVYHVANLTDGEHVVDLPLLNNDDTFLLRGDVIDGLTSTLVGKPLSANQGKILNEKIDTAITTFQNTVDNISKRMIPIARGISNDGIAYTATGDDLPTVKAGSSCSHIGKGRQIVFVPMEKNQSTMPTLQINGGEVIQIRLRAPKNQGTNEQSPEATLPVPVGALMVGVPYTMTFCGMYWLVDSQIAQYACGAPEMGVTDVTQEWLAWCDDNGIADADCTEFNVFSFLKTLSSGIYCLTTGFFGQVWALIYGDYAKRLVAVIEGRVYVGEDTVISDSGIIAYGAKKAKITDIAYSVYEDATSSYEAANTSGTLTPAEYVKRLSKDGKYRIRIGSVGDTLFEKMTVGGRKWLFGRSTDGVSVSYTIDRDDTTLLSRSTAGTAKIGDNTVLTDAFIAKPTSADTGKVLTVGAGGNPEWTAVVNAEEVAV